MIMLTACAKTEAIRTSKNTMLIQTSGPPACGVQGSLRVAQKMAAVETLRAGFDAYQIVGADAQNNVTTQTMPGTSYTSGYVMGGPNYASYSGSTTYQPGPTIFSGSNDVVLNLQMFKKGQKGYANAIPAKEVLGPDWQKLVQEGVTSCSG